MQNGQKSMFKTVPAINPAVISTSQTGRTIATEGFKSLTFLAQSGTLTDGTHTFTVKKSDTVDGSNLLTNAVDVPASELLGDQIVLAPADDNVCKRQGVLVRAKYYRIDSVVTGSPATGGAYGVQALLGDPMFAPVP